MGSEVNSWLDENRNCKFTKLRLVTIIGISGVNSAELNFIRFLLSTSPELNRMTIRPASVNGFSKLMKELVRFRRASVNAEIIYLDP